MTARTTQRQRVLAVLKAIQGEHDIPKEYIRRHASGDGISARYFKHVMLISEVNGRISELRGDGIDIETSVERDRYGFAYHRLKPAMTRADHLQIASDAVKRFDNHQDEARWR
jgi:hypothetical protein